jgi:hypothetical protein
VEFSFFLLLLTLFTIGIFNLFSVLFFTVNGLFEKGRRFFPGQWLMPVVLVMGSLVFFVCWFYLPRVPLIWEKIGEIVKNSLAGLGLLKSYRFIDVYYLAEDFRFVYPVWLVGLLTTAFLYSVSGWKKSSFWYRFLKNFDHRLIAAPVLLWTVFFIENYFYPQWIEWDWEMGLLNLCLFYSYFYVLYGFLTLFYGMRRRRFSQFFALAILYLALLLSGKFFSFPLIILMGVGISDIWMHYRRSQKKVMEEK